MGPSPKRSLGMRLVELQLGQEILVVLISGSDCRKIRKLTIVSHIILKINHDLLLTNDTETLMLH